MVISIRHKTILTMRENNKTLNKITNLKLPPDKFNKNLTSFSLSKTETGDESKFDRNLTLFSLSKTETGNKSKFDRNLTLYSTSKTETGDEGKFDRNLTLFSLSKTETVNEGKFDRNLTLFSLSKSERGDEGETKQQQRHKISVSIHLLLVDLRESSYHFFCLLYPRHT